MTSSFRLCTLASLLGLGLGLMSCSSSDSSAAPSADASVDSEPQADSSLEDAAVDSAPDAGDSGAEDVTVDSALLPDSSDGQAEADAPETSLSVTADNYCELSAEMFCSYYMRCGRIAESTNEACIQTFLEQCNSVYEPHYRALADQHLLTLSATGLEQCADYLRTVPCQEQVSDLQGPCATIWQGQVPSGGACGIGIESLVCDSQSACVVSVDLCGTCQPASGPGEACDDEHRCRYPSQCNAGTCSQLALPGEPCDDQTPCVMGAWCAEGQCTSPTIVGLSEPCNATHRCQYRAACVQGTCAQLPLLGQACTAQVGCASGLCLGGQCTALGEGGASCTAAGQCLSGVCDGSGQCAALPGACFQAP